MECPSGQLRLRYDGSRQDPGGGREAIGATVLPQRVSVDRPPYPASITTKDIADLHHELRGKPFQANRLLALLSKMLN